MNELFKVNADNERITISARELHASLKVSGTDQERFSKWFNRMLSYGFENEVDYTPYQMVHPQNKQEFTDYQITIDMAKEIAMLQRNEKGKEIRKKLIELEKAWNSPEKVMARALVMAQKEISSLKLENSEMKPKAEYHDKVLDTESCYTTTQIAKELEMSARQLNIMLNHLGVQYKQSGQWLLTKKYQDKGYVKTRTHLLSDSKTTHSTVWTEKGREFLIDLAEDF